MNRFTLCLLLMGSFACLGLTPITDEELPTQPVQVEYQPIAETPTDTQLHEIAGRFDKGRLIETQPKSFEIIELKLQAEDTKWGPTLYLQR